MSGNAPPGSSSPGARSGGGATSAVLIAVSTAAAGAARKAGERPALSARRTPGLSEEALDAKAEDMAQMIGQIADRVLKFVSDRMPGLEAWTISTLDTIFAPRLVLRHLMVAVALQTGLLTWNGLVAVANKLLSRMSRLHRDTKSCRQRMRTARNYEEWKMWAERLDELEGHDEWRKRPDSLLYNHKVLQQQIIDLNAMINAEDVFGLMFRLRGSLSRNQHGMLHEGLFSRAHAGTKVLVERYHEVVCEALHYVCAKNAVAQDIPTDAKLAFFNETRHAYGRTALMLSGGAAMGVYHAGVVKALGERRLLPRVISGASAGSIVAAMVGTRTDAELRPMFDGKNVNLAFFRPLRSFTRRNTMDNRYKNEAFWQLLVPPALRWMGERLWNVLLYSDGFLTMDTDYFRTVIRHNIGPVTFQEAFDRTGRIVNITVAPRNRTDPPRLLNYLTAPHVVVWSAAVCSSSVPGVFEPSTLLVKDADGSTHPESGPIEKFVDGSMEADLPMQQISELFNINHFIVSQVNPHASLLSTMALPKSVWSPPMYSFLVGLVGFLQAQARNWFRNVLEFVSLRRMAPVWASKRGGIQLLTQEYEGRHCDVTITPWEGEENVFSSFAKMLSNVSIPEFTTMVKVAERNTYPKVEMIRSHCAVEMGLEQCVQTLRRQLTAENQDSKIFDHYVADSCGTVVVPVPTLLVENAAVVIRGAVDILHALLPLPPEDPFLTPQRSNQVYDQLQQLLHCTVRMLAKAAQHPSSDGLRRRGRVPSFYTSRSIVNLSGLNVTDPSIVMEHPQAGDINTNTNIHSVNSANSNMSVSPALLALHNRRPSFGSRISMSSENAISEEEEEGGGDVGLSMEDGNAGQEERKLESAPHRDNSMDSWTEGGRHNGLSREWESEREQERGDLRLDSEGYPIVAAAAGGGSDGPDASSSSVSSPVPPETTDLGWVCAQDLTALGLARQDDVVKSTSMAKFYYRRSRSMDASMNEMRQNSTSSGNLSTHSEPSF